jgi:short subunit dehydrogenase-like uncharacterized protein
MAETRDYDIVLFGATGFTGQLTADYLAAHAPAQARIALAGRNRTKLEAAVARVSERRPAGAAPVALVVADVTDEPSLERLARATRVVVTTVGPYLQYGEPLVAACAAAGTGYLDLTGEPEFVDRMYLRYHDAAVQSGARLIHAAGFDSIPHDLGVLYTVDLMPENVPLAINGYVWARGLASGGTYHSAVGAMSRLRQSTQVARERNQAEKAAWAANGRKVHGSTRPPHREAVARGWVISAPLIDPQIVLRSARALPEYGPDFSYGHYLAAGSLKNLALITGAVAAIVTLAQTGPTRRLALKLRAPGDGPDEATRAKGKFRVTFVAEGGGRRIVTAVSGGDPGYGETAKMLSEAAMCLAFDELSETAGQVTTAQALGRPLIRRLQAAGISFRDLES